MKKAIYLIIVIVMSLAICSCQLSNNESMETASEDYTTEFIKKLNRMDVLIDSPNTLDDEFKSDNWYVDHMILPDNDTMVSLYKIKVKTHLYNLVTEGDLVLNEYDLTDLYLNKSPKQEEFEDFYNWHLYGTESDRENGNEKYDNYYKGMATGYRLYRESNGHEFKDKDIFYLTAEDELELEQWIKENPDYDTASEDYCYNSYLKLLGVENLPEVATEGERIYTFY